MNIGEMRESASKSLSGQLTLLGLMGSKESVVRMNNASNGYLLALKDAGIFSHGECAEWKDRLDAACDKAIKKAASGAANTESGKEDHPKKDDSLDHESSVDENSPDVKPGGGTYIIARSSGDGLCHFEAAGGIMELTACGASVISGLSRRLQKDFVIAAILSGCDHAGISVDELVSTYKGAHHEKA